MNDAITTSHAITAEIRQIWTLLCSEGGWWSVKRLAVYWSPNVAQHEMQAALDVLEAGRFIMSRDHATDLAYGFTSECRPLPGQAAPRPVDAL